MFEHLDIYTNKHTNKHTHKRINTYTIHILTYSKILINTQNVYTYTHIDKLTNTHMHTYIHT